MNKIPKPTLNIIKVRSGNRCEVDGCVRLDLRGIVCAHIQHRGIGGRNGEAEKIINDPRNIAYICCYHHDILDSRVYAPIEKQRIIHILKEKLGWNEWANEAREKGIKVRID